MDVNAQGYHPSPHGRLRRELHQAVARVGKGQGAHINDDQSAGEQPIVGGDGGQCATESEYRCTDLQ